MTEDKLPDEEVIPVEEIFPMREIKKIKSKDPFKILIAILLVVAIIVFSVIGYLEYRSRQVVEPTVEAEELTPDEIVIPITIKTIDEKLNTILGNQKFIFDTINQQTDEE